MITIPPTEPASVTTFTSWTWPQDTSRRCDCSMVPNALPSIWAQAPEAASTSMRLKRRVAGTYPTMSNHVAPVTSMLLMRRRPMRLSCWGGKRQGHLRRCVPIIGDGRAVIGFCRTLPQVPPSAQQPGQRAAPSRLHPMLPCQLSQRLSYPSCRKACAECKTHDRTETVGCNRSHKIKARNRRFH